MTPPVLDTGNGGESSAQGTWREWARHVLIELERSNAFSEAMTARLQEHRGDTDMKFAQLRQELQTSAMVTRDSLNTDIGNLRVELAALKVKAGLWGALGATAPILVMVCIELLVRFIENGGL